jgi:hypothetical protein
MTGDRTIMFGRRTLYLTMALATLLTEKHKYPVKVDEQDPNETPEAKRKLLKKNPVLAKHKASKDNKAELAKNFLNKQRRKQK